MAALVSTPSGPYQFPDLPVPASWESGSLVFQAARAQVERQITLYMEKLKAQKKDELAKANSAAKNAVAKGSANAAKLTSKANMLRAEVDTVGKGAVPKVNSDPENVELHKLIKRFQDSFDFETEVVETRASSAASAAAATPPAMVYRKALLAKLKAHNTRNPGTKLNMPSYERYKANAQNAFTKKLGSRATGVKLDPNDFFMGRYKARNFSGGSKRKTRRM